ncbi:MAG: nucleoside deaminase [Bacilli bacterium]
MKEIYMNEAINEAKKSLVSNDVPVGCVIVKNNKIIGRGHNTRNRTNSTIAHAEINAISDANSHLNNWVLEDCELYVTIEPCQMCTGAIIQSRIKKIYFGAADLKAGCVTSIYNLLDEKEFNHQVEYEYGILEVECSKLIKDFFKKLRRFK